MEYLVLQQSERDLDVARAIHAREQEYANYALNVANYRRMIDIGIDDETFRTQLEKAIVESLSEMKKVELVHKALCKELPEGDRRDAAFKETLSEVEKKKRSS